LQLFGAAAQFNFVLGVVALQPRRDDATAGGRIGVASHLDPVTDAQ